MDIYALSQKDFPQIKICVLFECLCYLGDSFDQKMFKIEVVLERFDKLIRDTEVLEPSTTSKTLESVESFVTKHYFHKNPNFRNEGVPKFPPFPKCCCVRCNI